MFRRYPYRGWLLLSILLWCLAGFRFFEKTKDLRPQEMAKAIAADLHEQERNCERLLEDKELIQRLFSERPTDEDIERITHLPYYLYGYDASDLIFWNTNEVLADCSFLRENRNVILEQNDRGSFIKKCFSFPYLDSSQKLTVLIPIITRYPFENSYLLSHFEAADYIPTNIQVLAKPEKNSYEVKAEDGRIRFYVQFPSDSITEWIPGKVILWTLSFALLTTILWFQLITVYFTRKKSPWVGFAITALAIIGVRALTYVTGFPFNLGSLAIFSPLLYASSSFLPSLGDLLINALCFLWIILFTLRHIPYRFFEGVNLPKWVRLLLAVVFTILMVQYTFSFINIIRSLVLDSRISFYVSYFYSITFYTIVGLLTIVIIGGVSFLLIYLFNIQLTSLVKNRWLKYLLVAIVGAIWIYLTKDAETYGFRYLVLFWLVLFVIFSDIKQLSYISDLFAPQMIFWGVLACVFCTGLLQYFNYTKENDTRKRFAEQVVKQRDYVTEYEFRTISTNIQKDEVLKNFLASPSPDRRRTINERLDANYLGGQLNKYQAKVFLFDTTGAPLFNNDTSGYEALSRQAASSEMTTEPTLFYRENALDGHYYLASIPIVADSNGRKLGHAFIDFAVKVSAGEAVYPELLQPGSVKSNQNEAGYSYGVYVNNRLITQSGDYSFPIFRTPDTVTATHKFFQLEDASELRYKYDPTKTVLVIRSHKIWLESITLFSYLFGILMLIVLFIVIYRLVLTYFTLPKLTGKLISFTLRKRIHYSMLGVILISFFIIGIVTIYYFTLQYKQANQRKMQTTMQLVERSVLNALKEYNGLTNIDSFKTETSTARFKYFISSLANAQKIDINIFDGSGILRVSSQENIYNKILLARIIRPDAYYELNNEKKSMVIQDEKIGRLSYLSSYAPLTNEEGRVLGYINVPVFASGKELNFQISNILVALINLYAFIFLLSGLLTVFITQWITRSFSIVINRFEKLSLTRNELIDWPYDDEIGLLIKEYNKMVKKVEENAIMLAQNEREMAWREMARQVAHEIKNPLTPMKLNIQYLQQALRSGYKNVGELAGKVSESLIEQIDNLSYIASEFSNFAKMPEAKPEEIDLNALLDKAVELYLNEESVKVTAEKPDEKLFVYSDRSQLLRVFTNLLENAVQSISDEKDGRVEVSLSKDGTNALISISDNGEGISAQVIEKIFQPYFTTKSSGTGLGLAMTKKIIEFWKGTIWFETREGIGTTFHIKLPLVQQ